MEPLFDLDPLIHSANLSKNRRSLDRRISFTRPVSGSYSSITLALPSHSPPIESSTDLARTSRSSRSLSLDQGSKEIATDRSPVIAKQLFPAESLDSQPTLSKQEARQLQRKELSQKAETTWKSSGIRTRSVATKSIPKLSTDTKPVNPPPHSHELKKKVDQPLATRALRSSSLTASSHESAPQHSLALQSAAHKAVAIFTSRISKKTTESSAQPRTPSQPSDRTPKRPSQTSHPRTPQYPTTSKTKTPSSGLRSSITSVSSASIASSTSHINVQRTNSGSSLSTSSSQRRDTDSSLSTTSNSHGPLKSSTIKASSRHHFKPKSVTVASATEKQIPTVPPPTLRGGGGKSTRGINSTLSNASGEGSASSSTQRMKERTKPTVPVSALQSKKSFDERTRQAKQLSSSHSSVKSEEGQFRILSTLSLHIHISRTDLFVTASTSSSSQTREVRTT